MAMLRKKEAAARLGVGEKTMDYLVSSGELPSYRIAKSCIRIDEADLAAYMERCRSHPAPVRQPRGCGRPQKPRVCTYVPGEKVV